MEVKYIYNNVKEDKRVVCLKKVSYNQEYFAIFNKVTEDNEHYGYVKNLICDDIEKFEITIEELGIDNVKVRDVAFHVFLGDGTLRTDLFVVFDNYGVNVFDIDNNEYKEIESLIIIIGDVEYIYPVTLLKGIKGDINTYQEKIEDMCLV